MLFGAGSKHLRTTKRRDDLLLQSLVIATSQQCHNSRMVFGSLMQIELYCMLPKKESPMGYLVMI